MNFALEKEIDKFVLLKKHTETLHSILNSAESTVH